MTEIRRVLFALCFALSCTVKHVQAFSPMPAVRPSATTPTSLAYASTERSCIELIDPETGCEVILVGCFHGSPSSARDVEREVETSPTDVVALELCASRFDDLSKMMASQESAKEGKKEYSPRVVRFAQIVGSTIERKGLSTGVATGILVGISGLQTALSGFTPGLEFITAVQASQKQQQQQNGCDIILADQSVDETIEKVGQLPQVVKSMINEIKDNVSDLTLEDTQWGQMATNLRTALTGDPDLGPDYQVNVGSVVTRSTASILEMARLMVPPIVVTQIALILVNQALFPDPMLNTQDGLLALFGSFFFNPFVQIDPVAFVVDAAPHVLLLSLMMTCAYSLLAVPITQVILAERDDQLTAGIKAACQVASSKHAEERGRVVAVLGLLHVNGVAKRLLESKEFRSAATVEKESLVKDMQNTEKA